MRRSLTVEAQEERGEKDLAKINLLTRRME